MRRIAFVHGTGFDHMGLKSHFRWTLFATIVAMPLSAFTMDFRLTNKSPIGEGTFDGPNQSLLLHGEIQPGDYERLLKYAAANHIVLAQKLLILASPGGDAELKRSKVAAL